MPGFCKHGDDPREERRLKVFENKNLERISETKRSRNTEIGKIALPTGLHNLNFSLMLIILW